MRLMLGLASLAFLVACATEPAPSVSVPAKAAAVSPAATTQPASQPVAAADKKVCRSMLVTGSLTSRRICSTQAEWDAFDKKAKDGSDRFDEQRKQGGSFRGETAQ